MLNQTLKRPCLFAEHCIGGGKTAEILAEFSSENHLLAPLWFALKSRLLRQFKIPPRNEGFFMPQAFQLTT
jgi:hypothetical protein